MPKPAQDTPPITVLGFDFGLKHIGVAVGQTLTRTATALQTVRAQNGMPNWDIVKQLINQWRPQAIVVGIPLNMDGTEQPITHNAQNFIQELKTRFQLPVHEVDERLTTIAARAELFEQGGYRALKKQKIDNLAAKLILESWLGSL